MGPVLRRLSVLVVFAAGVAACGDEDRGVAVVQQLNRLVADAADERPTRVVTLSDATEFDWDRVTAGEFSEPPGVTLEFREDGDQVVTATGFEGADFGCFQGAEGYGPEAMRFLVWEHRYRHGGLYRLLLPAAVSTDLNHPELVQCVRRRVPELLDRYRRAIS